MENANVPNYEWQRNQVTLMYMVCIPGHDPPFCHVVHSLYKSREGEREERVPSRFPLTYPRGENGAERKTGPKATRGKSYASQARESNQPLIISRIFRRAVRVIVSSGL